MDKTNRKVNDLERECRRKMFLASPPTPYQNAQEAADASSPPQINLYGLECEEPIIEVV